jgi:hypothetical protein
LQWPPRRRGGGSIFCSDSGRVVQNSTSENGCWSRCRAEVERGAPHRFEYTRINQHLEFFDLLRHTSTPNKIITARETRPPQREHWPQTEAKRAPGGDGRGHEAKVM